VFNTTSYQTKRDNMKSDVMYGKPLLDLRKLWSTSAEILQVQNERKKKEYHLLGFDAL
jgi:hypothetical protein